MLDFLGVVENTWMPPSLSADEIDRLCMDHLTSDKSDMDFLAIIKIEPYIDSLYIHYDDRNNPFSVYTKRFTFNEGFRWGDEEEGNDHDVIHLLRGNKGRETKELDCKWESL